MTGVELDPTSAAISRALYPDATVRTESFAATRYPAGHFDAVVGNVPFADVRLHDPRHNPGGHAIHNHFIIKSLALTRPGGMVAVLTSRYTLDSTNPAARREMNQLGDLVGAVRLPTGAHRRAAGTDVVTDLVILRRHALGFRRFSEDDEAKLAGWRLRRSRPLSCRTSGSAKRCWSGAASSGSSRQRGWIGSSEPHEPRSATASRRAPCLGCRRRPWLGWRHWPGSEAMDRTRPVPPTQP